MKLTIDYTYINSVGFGNETSLDGKNLIISKEELLSLVDMSFFESADIEIARPGDNVRILGIADCTQPRVKADAPDAGFPGIIGKIAPAGDGRTTALKGVLVTELNPLRANVKSLIDMTGPIADVSILSKHNHIILLLYPKDGVSDESFCRAQKIAALKISEFLAKFAISQEPDESVCYELYDVKNCLDVNGKPLPKVAYLTSHWAGAENAQFLFYGQDSLGMLPIAVHPNEILDGAFVYNYFQPTYFSQEEAMIKELYARHGKDIEFTGVILSCGKTETAAKEASSMAAVMMAKNYLDADITINTMAGMGHCQLEQQMIHTWSEKLGMKAVTMMSGVSVEKPGDLLVITDDAVDAAVHSGSGKIMEFPYIENLIGQLDIPALMAFDLHGPFTASTNLTVAGVYSKQGAYYLYE